ncbi:hypothetical protein AVEN_114721-1 [Araneus ventricosus]|uniref:Uncharacterized protein n=1 Tax=Araneus ventricosus TaxID=182803 RepID=A0A4Y2WMK5_ARAVE|nr:hypothetical protein AVEN_114721-1 [Araneus ventricosus]
MQLHELFGGQLLIVFFHKLIDIIAIHLQSPDLGQRHDLVNYRIRRVTVSDSLMPNSTALSDQSFFQEEMRILLVTPSHAFSIILRQETMWK